MSADHRLFAHDAAPALEAGEARIVLANLKLLSSQLQHEGYELITTCDLEWVAQIFRSWGEADAGQTKLSRNADPRYWPDDSRPDRTIAILLIKDGKVMGTAVQRWHWLDGTLREAMETRRFFYGPGLARAPRNEICRVDAPIGDQLADTALVYSCALHVDRPASKHTAWRLSRLAHGLALARWHWSFMTARITSPVQRYLLESAYGFPSAEKGIWIAEPDGRMDPGIYFFAVPRRYLRRLACSTGYGEGDKPLIEPPPMEALLDAGVGQKSQATKSGSVQIATVG